MPTIAPQPPSHDSPDFSNDTSSSRHKPIPHPKDPAPTPWTRLEFRDLSHPGSQSVLSNPSLNLSTLVSDAIHAVQKHLDPHSHHGLSPARSISLIFRPNDGVAYTTGRDFDDQHKEIHFSTVYIEARVKQGLTQAELAHEIVGVVTHEMVHVWQFNGQGTANGGLIEGIADWVRMQAGLAPPHWKRVVSGKSWDSGYETTAFFLQWLEEKYGSGTVRRINWGLRERYVEGEFWRGLFGGRSVQDLWRRYVAAVEGEDGAGDGEEKGKQEEGQKNGQKEQIENEKKQGDEVVLRTNSESLRQWEVISHENAE